MNLEDKERVVSSNVAFSHHSSNLETTGDLELFQLIRMAATFVEVQLASSLAAGLFVF